MAVGGIAFVVLAVLLVPWSPVPGGTPDPVAGRARSSRPSEIARGEDYARLARVWSWSSLAVSLVVACVLGFSRWGRRLVGRLPGWWWVRVVLAVAVGRAGRPGRDAAVRGAAAPARARLRAEHPGVVGLRRRPRHEPGGHARGDLAAAGRADRLRPALAAGLAGGRRRAARRAGAGRVVRLPGPRRAAVQRLPLAARRASCAPRSSSSPTARACRSTTCWSPTRRAVRRP